MCRMKTVRASVALRERISILNQPTDGFLLRFIAVSATVPNIEDVRIKTASITIDVHVIRLSTKWTQSHLHVHVHVHALIA